MGAWIETYYQPLTKDIMALVAPRVGAWIETFKQYDEPLRLTSHPVWVRGLKL